GFDAEDGKMQLVSEDLIGPYVFGFTTDEKFFYVDNWDDHKRVVMSYEVQPDGSIRNGKLFFDMTSAGTEDALDGLKVDKAGNLYVSGPGGFWIYRHRANISARSSRRNIRTILPGATRMEKLSTSA